MNALLKLFADLLLFILCTIASVVAFVILFPIRLLQGIVRGEVEEEERP